TKKITDIFLHIFDQKAGSAKSLPFLLPNYLNRLLILRFSRCNFGTATIRCPDFAGGRSCKPAN
ncbi:MAG: hypothetical protein KDH95_23085, partial [Calditrichaeota bacterium]|nr:hypothetical protein [Calditrichota bacterium]